ncbi:MAG TPA: hypothetical protein VGG28_14015 [Kofleriaceae bacterium]|jgi:hypothetical protein
MNAGIILTVMLVGALASGLVAMNKGRSGAAWALFGAFFPLISLVAICVVRPRPDELAL